MQPVTMKPMEQVSIYISNGRRIEVNERKSNWFVITLLFVISLNIFRNTVPALFF